MSIAEIKNNLHRMVVETDDPEILVQIAALFASLPGKQDWWDFLSNEEKKKIEEGEADSEAGRTVPYSEVKKRAKGILGNL